MPGEEPVEIRRVALGRGVRSLAVASVRLVINGHLGVVLCAPQDVVGHPVVRARLEEHVGAARRELVPILRDR